MVVRNNYLSIFPIAIVTNNVQFMYMQNYNVQ